MPGIAGDRTLVLAMPVKALSPVWGKSVGGVSEGPARRIHPAEQSEGWTPDADASGGRHPGPRDGVDLRGSASECGSWFGPATRTGLLPSRRTHRRQRMSRGCRGRERRPHALFEAHAPDARTQKCGSHGSAEDASFTWSSDPCTLIATSTPRGNSRRWRVEAGIAVGKTRRKPGGTGTGV
jgi:hypothetical protein